MTADLVRGLLTDARLHGPSLTAHGAAPGTVSNAAPSPRPAHNLPADLTSFIGRGRERVEIARLLETARLVMLTGVGGVGKTRLALRVADDLAADCADGVWLVELAVVSEPTLIQQAAARALGVREQPGRAMVETVVEHLRPRRVLLVLDNCEHLVAAAACAELIGRLLRGCPDLRILATSRAPLGVPGEITWQVPPLAVPPDDGAPPGAALAGAEAVRLFAERARAVLPGFILTEGNSAAVGHICRRLDGIPLAIELAAAWARVLARGEITARLDDRFGLLVGGVRAAPARKQTLRAALDWSYDALDAAERRLFARLSVFAGDFGLDATETVCGGDGIAPATVLDLLARLVDASLVLADVSVGDEGTRYRLLETVRAYGWERLGAGGETDVVPRRQAAWVVAMAERAARAFHGPDQGAWLHWTEREHANVRAAMDWALDRGEADTALRLAAALTWSWGVHGRWTEGRSWPEQALALPDPDGAAPAGVRANVLTHLVTFALFQGDFAMARSSVDAAVGLNRVQGNDAATLATRVAAAQPRLFAGEVDAASEAINEALALARRLGDAWHKGRLLEMAAQLAVRRGEAAVAAALLEEDVRIARKIGDTWSLATALGELGDLVRSHGAHARAGAFYAESLALREGIGIPGATASLRHNLGYVALAAGDVAAAMDRFAAALTEFERLGARRGVAECLIGLAAAAATAGQAGDAARLFGAGEAALDALGSSLWPSNRGDFARCVALARAELDVAAFEAAWAEGRGLTLERAVSLARDFAGAGG